LEDYWRDYAEINFQKVENFQPPKSDINAPRFTTQFTTNSPQKTTQKTPCFSKTPCKNATPPHHKKKRSGKSRTA
jgi:hypothetical protein